MHDLAPEMALGVLSGDERGAAIAHLETCAQCQVDLSLLADVADQLLLAAPRIDPPAGFELRVLSRLATAEGDDANVVRITTADAIDRRARRPRRWSARAIGVAAAALLIFVARPADEPRVAAAADVVAMTGETIGRAAIEGDDPARVTIDMPGWASTDPPYVMPVDEPYRIRVEHSDGTTTFADLTYSTGATWRASLPASSIDDVVSVEVVDSDQRVWCSADFSA
jgi:hypothetical protein